MVILEVEADSNQVVTPKAGRADKPKELHEAHPGETQMKRLARTSMFCLVTWIGS